MKSPRLILLACLLGIAVLSGIFLADQTEVAVTSMPSVASTGSMKSTETPVASPSAASSSSAQSPIFHISAWNPQTANLQPLAPEETVASRQAISIADISRDSLPTLSRWQKGDRVRIPVSNGRSILGVVNLVKPDQHGWVRVGGSIQDGKQGSFSLSQRGNEFGGLVRLPGEDRAYFITTSKTGVTMTEKPLNTALCVGLKKRPLPPGVTAVEQERTQAAAREISATATITVPALDSVPTATAVLYLDFDGELVEDPNWNDGFSINARPAVLGSQVISAAAITDVWKRVVEDFKPFNLSVTTIRSRYDNAPAGRRMRCIVTNTTYWYPGIAGVAGLDSFAEGGGSYYSDTVPCWTFVYTTDPTIDIASTISHEVGHTFGLSHDSLFNASLTDVIDEYYPGHGRWGPIMGVTYDRAVSQWSKCEFKNGSNSLYNPVTSISYTGIEDDLAIIGSVSRNGFGYLPDDASDVPGDNVLANTGTFNLAGVIDDAADEDIYTFSTRGGATTIVVNPAPVDPNLDVRIELRDNTGTILQSALPTPAMNAAITRTLTAGTYHISVRSSGDGNPLNTGYSTYGSIGAYTITGTFPAVPDAVPTISVHPVSQTIAIGSKTVFSVIATSNIPITYQWKRNNINIPGAVAATFTMPSTQPAHEGTYICVVSNSVGPAPSDPATLSLNFKPSITAQPVKITVGAGGITPLNMSVTAIGTSVLNYQWQKNNVNIGGANSPSFSIATPQFTDGGTYRCIVSNAFGSVTSLGALATVTSAPVITVPLPATKGVPLAGTATLSIGAVGSPTLLYQWFKNNVAISGATKSVLTLASITAATSATYRCDVKNTVNSILNVVPSTDCIVTAGNAPKITTQPVATLAIDVAAALNLSVVATGDASLSYQWQRDGINISGATSDTLNIPAITWNERGTYRCIVTNTFGSIISKNAVVTVHSAPIIVSSPVSRKLARNAKTTLTVVATGSPTLKYQWRKDGANITSGGTGAALVVTGLATASYDCIVTNTIGNATSVPATVTVEDPPKITALPAAPLAAFGGTFNLPATVTGSPTLTFVWKKNNVVMPAQTTSTLQLTNLQSSDAGTYTLTVSNDVGTVTSNAMKLTLQTAPIISLDPLSQTAFAFTTVTFSTAATGSATLRYQWMKNGTDIPGATTTKLTLPAVQTSNDGNYSVRATNAVGTATSAIAMLTVTPVAAPTLNAFTPSQASVGHYIRLFGTNLNWTTAVQMQKNGGGLVNAPFVIVSPTELLVTIPAGTTTTPTFTAVTRGGSATTVDSLLIRTAPNDLFADARIIPGAGGQISGSMPSTFTAESGEQSHAYFSSSDSDYLPVYSAWHSFTPTVSGTYAVSTAGSAFDTRLAVYEGTDPGSATPLAANDDYDYDAYLDYSYLRFEAIAGTTYHIVVDGFDYSGYSEFGNYVLKVSRLVFAAPRAITARSQLATGSVAVLDSETVRLGGTVSNKPAVVWDSQSTAGEQFEYAATFSFDAPAGSRDQCSFVASNALGIAQFALTLSAQSGALSLIEPTGKTLIIGQTLVSGHDYQLTLRVDNASHTWGALLNGEWIVRDASWPSIGGNIRGLSNQWLPGAGNSMPSTFTVSHGTITVEK